jgi:DNA-binding HxlR family transcriptional regulator
MTDSERTPLPGTAVRGSDSGRPIMALLDLVGRRWALRILWELRSKGAKFRDLQMRCDDMSPSVLSVRLKELSEASLVVSDEVEGWKLTEHGRSLLLVLAPLVDWSGRWAKRVSDKDREPAGGA